MSEMGNATDVLAEAGLVQCVVFERGGRIVQSHGGMVGTLPVGESLFDHLPLLHGLGSVVDTAKVDDFPISLPGVTLPGADEDESFDFSMRPHPNGDDIVLMVSHNSSLSGKAAQQIIAGRRERFVEEQLLRERARFEYIYDNTPVRAFAYDGQRAVRAITGELRRWLGPDVDPARWISQSFPHLRSLVDETGKPQPPVRHAVSRSACRVSVVDVTLLRVPSDTGEHEYLVVLDDVTERVGALNSLMRHRNELEATSAKLETSNRRLEQFAYVAAHDLLGPLGRMATFSEIIELEVDEGLSGMVATAVSAIRTSSVESLELVNDLLTLAKMSHAALVPEELDFRALVEGLVQQLPDAAQAELVPAADPVADAIVLNADPRLVRLIARNLIGNSYKYRRTNVPLRIELSLLRLPDAQLILSVSDNGSGFHSHEIDPFEAFARMREHAQEEGIGLGLAMVKDAAEAMGWEPGVASVRGLGTTISFRGVAGANLDDV